MGWYPVVAAPVVPRTLLAAVNTADGEPIRLVEERRRLVVLQLAVFHHQPVAGPVGVDRQFGLTPRTTRVTEQPVEPVLTPARFAEDLIAQVQHVRLVAALSSHARR